MTGRGAIEVRTRLGCDPAALWRVLLDFDRWPEWNPVFWIRGAGAGPVRAGDRLTLILRRPLPLVRSLALPIVILEHVPGRSLAWRGGLRGVLSGVHFLRLIEEEGAAFLSHGETITGLRPLLWLATPRIDAYRRAYAEVSARLVERAARAG